jgi:hypothetical protein
MQYNTLALAEPARCCRGGRSTLEYGIHSAMNMRRSQDDALIPVDVAGSIRSDRARIRLDVLDRQQSGGLSYP